MARASDDAVSYRVDNDSAAQGAAVARGLREADSRADFSAAFRDAADYFNGQGMTNATRFIEVAAGYCSSNEGSWSDGDRRLSGNLASAFAAAANYQTTGALPGPDDLARVRGVLANESLGGEFHDVVERFDQVALLDSYAARVVPGDRQSLDDVCWDLVRDNCGDYSNGRGIDLQVSYVMQGYDPAEDPALQWNQVRDYLDWAMTEARRLAEYAELERQYREGD